jgi:hypothetical protein
LKVRRVNRQSNLPAFFHPDYFRGGKGFLVVLACVLVGCIASFLLEAHSGFSLWDEGYLWYGVQRTLLGEVPLRDFMSYDPGRYYWVAALLGLFHARGIVAIYAATALFAAFGVAAAAALIWCSPYGSKKTRFWLCLVTIALCLLWMVPWWKQYDEAVSIALVVSLARVLTLPVPRRFLSHGLVVGLAAVLGRNHGLYGVVACLLALPLLMRVIDRGHWIRCAWMFVLGVILGFSPILIGLCIDHSFASMFWESIRYILFEYKGTNLPLPVPWPWKVSMTGETVAWARSMLIGCMYVVLPLFCCCGLALVARGVFRERKIADPAFAACVLTAVPYMNVAFSRADPPHLAQAIFPFLLGGIVWLLHLRRREWARAVYVALLVSASLWIMLPMHPRYTRDSQGNWRKVAVGRDTLWMSDDVAASVEDVEQLTHSYLSRGGTLLSVPVWPGAYALAGVKSPVYEIYPLFPHNDSFQAQEIARLQRAQPALVLFNDVAVDGRNDLRYGVTHPLLMGYIDRHYHAISSPAKEPQLKVYVLNGLASQ